MTQATRIEQELLTNDTSGFLSRRTLLKDTATVGLGISVLGLTGKALAADGTQQPEATPDTITPCHRQMRRPQRSSMRA